MVAVPPKTRTPSSNFLAVGLWVGLGPEGESWNSSQDAGITNIVGRCTSVTLLLGPDLDLFAFVALMAKSGPRHGLRQTRTVNSEGLSSWTWSDVTFVDMGGRKLVGEFNPLASQRLHGNGNGDGDTPLDPSSVLSNHGRMYDDRSGRQMRNRWRGSVVEGDIKTRRSKRECYATFHIHSET